MFVFFFEKSYEELYDQGSMKLRLFNQYAKKLIERFPDLQIVIERKLETIQRIWSEFERHLINYLDEDFDRIVQG